MLRWSGKCFSHIKDPPKRKLPKPLTTTNTTLEEKKTAMTKARKHEKVARAQRLLESEQHQEETQDKEAQELKEQKQREEKRAKLEAKRLEFQRKQAHERQETIMEQIKQKKERK